jgi:hypothetical protein
LFVVVLIESVPVVASMIGAAALNVRLPPIVAFPVVAMVVKLGVVLTAIVAFVVPEMLMFEPAVSSAASFWNVGVPVPPEVSTWFALPAEVNPYAVPVPYATAPAVGVADEFVPPCAIANCPDVTCDAAIAIGVFVTPVTRPWASVVNTGTEEAEPYVLAVPVFFNVITPVDEIVASPLAVVNVGTLDALPISNCPPVGASVACTAPPPLPKSTPFAVSVVSPVPPFGTVSALLSASDGIETEVAPLEPLCVKVSVEVGFVPVPNTSCNDQPSVPDELPVQ